MNKQLPILFSTAMVQAILEGRKTQTRRIVKPQPSEHHWEILPGYKQGVNLLDATKGLVASFYDYRAAAPQERNVQARCPYGRAGNILYVRETWQLTTWEHPTSENYGYIYQASENGQEWEQTEDWKWKPSLFMPKEAARIFLQITDIRVERLWDITESDAFAEGIDDEGDSYIEAEQAKLAGIRICAGSPAQHSFANLWMAINGPESWQANPWVWVISFERTEKPE